MHMVMRHGMVRPERSVKNTHSFRWRARGLGRRCHEDARRQRERDEPPSKNLTTRILAIYPENEVPALTPQ